MAYQFIDGYGSVLTADSSIISGSGVSGTQRPVINIGSVLSVIPTTGGAAQSVSGTVGASIIGLAPVNIIGTPSISGAVTVVGNPSISGTVNIAGNPSISGTVNIGNTNVNVGGSVVAFLGTNPWPVTAVGSIIGINIGSIITTNIGSVITVLQGASIVGTYAEDAGHTTADKGLFVLGVRNDAVASFASANLEYGPIGTDSAGRVIGRPFAPEESRVEGYASTVNVSVTTLVAAAGTGLRNYITDIVIANTGAAATLVTFKDGLASVLGYTIAPAGGGSNLIGFATPMRTGTNATFDFQASTGTSVLYGTVKGYKGP